MLACTPNSQWHAGNLDEVYLGQYMPYIVPKLCMSFADTVKPTAQITGAANFTSASRVSVNITFSEPCGGGAGFGCSSVNACNVSRWPTRT